ncbi:MAG: VCBS repeat-containing protein, partial [Planctomycetota bacterium]|nr:VCBS repeat-containing protein [Planctomycetota bacterium]
MLYPFQSAILQIRKRCRYVPKVSLSCLGSLVMASVATAQSFGSQQVITTSADYGISVYATDLDGDGDADVLSASRFDDKIAWYENQGGGVFGAQQVITTSVNHPYSVYA